MQESKQKPNMKEAKTKMKAKYEFEIRFRVEFERPLFLGE